MVDATIQDGSPKPQLMMHRIYTKSSVFEAAIFDIQWVEKPLHPEVEQRINATIHPKENGMQEAVLSIELTAKHAGNLVWRLQLQQAGLYALENIGEEQQERILYGFCMNQLHPYVSAEVNHLVTQGGFLPVVLVPVNFEQLCLEQQKSEASKISDQEYGNKKEPIHTAENIALLKEAIKKPASEKIVI